MKTYKIQQKTNVASKQLRESSMIQDDINFAQPTQPLG